MRASAPRLLAVLALALGASILAGCGDGDETVPTTSGADPLASIEGKWEGTLQQAKTPPFPIEVTIASATVPERNRVRYGGAIDCSGVWRYLDGEGPGFNFEETITGGAGGRCKGKGTVTLELTGNQIGYEFRGGGVESRGTLTRSSSSS